MCRESKKWKPSCGAWGKTGSKSSDGVKNCSCERRADLDDLEEVLVDLVERRQVRLDALQLVRSLPELLVDRRLDRRRRRFRGVDV